MAVEAEVVTVGTTPVVLTKAQPTDFGPGQSLAVSVPTGGVTVYIGPSTVTSSTGLPLAAGGSASFDLQFDSDQLYAVVATGTQGVNVLRIGV